MCYGCVAVTAAVTATMVGFLYDVSSATSVLSGPLERLSLTNMCSQFVQVW